MAESGHLMTEIKITGDGTFGSLQPGWSVNEDATPVAIGDSSGGIDSLSLSVSQGENSEFFSSESAELYSDDLGSFFGSVSTVDSDGADQGADTTVPLSVSGLGKGLTSTKTTVVAYGNYNVLYAGKVLDSKTDYARLIAVRYFQDGEETNDVYRVEGPPVGATGIHVVKRKRDGSQQYIKLTGADLPTSLSSVYSFIHGADDFILFYLSGSGVRKLGWFNRTTGALIAAVGSNGTGNGQFGSIYSGGTQLVRVINKIYLADYGNNRVQIFDEFTRAFVSKWAVSSPKHIAGTSEGIPELPGTGPTIYVQSGSNLFITEYAIDGVPTERIVPSPADIGSIAVDFDRIIVSSGDRVILYGRQNGEYRDAFQSSGVTFLNIVISSSIVYVSSTTDSVTSEITIVLTDPITPYAAFAHYAALGGIDYISYQGDYKEGPAIPMGAWTDTPWNKIKELAASQNLEVAIVDGIFTVREVGTRVLELDNIQGASASLRISDQGAARSVGVSWSGLSPTLYSVFYKLPYSQTISFKSGEVRTSSVPITGQPSYVAQPVYGEDYVVMGIHPTTGSRYPISPWLWVNSGASLSVQWDASKPNGLEMTIVAPVNPLYDNRWGSAILFTDFELGSNYATERQRVVAENLALNPGGFTGSNWSKGPGLSVVYSPTLPPVWTVLSSTDSYAVVNLSAMFANVPYRLRVKMSTVSGTVSSIGVLQAGGLPFASIGAMTLSGGTWTWEGVITPTATALSPQVWLSVVGSVGAKVTLQDFVLVQRGGFELGASFDGGTPAAGYSYRWTGAAFSSVSQKYTRTQVNSNLEIRGRGLNDTGRGGSIDLLTGANPNTVSTEKASDVSNPFLTLEAQAYDRGIWRAEQLNGLGAELRFTIPTHDLDGFGLTAGSLVRFKDCMYRITNARIGNVWTAITATRYNRQSDTQAINAGRTMGQVDNFWDGIDYKDQMIKPLRDDANLYPSGAVGKRYYATADSFGTLQGTVVSYITLLKDELSFTPYTNVSVGSRCAQDGAQEAWGNVTPVPYSLGPDSFGHIAFGINPALQAGLNPLMRAAEKGAMEQLIWAMCAESRLSNDAWAKWPTDWGIYSNSGLKDGNAYVAEAAGYQATMTPAAGSYVGIGYSFSTAGGASVAGTGIWKRGSTVVQENDTSKPPATAWGNLLVPHPVRFMNLNGSTQISVDSVAAQYTTLDSLVKLSATPPWIVVVKPTYILPSSPHFIPNSTVDAYRSDIDSVVESVGNSYAPVANKLIVVDPVTMGWNPTIHTSSDGLHPSDLGARFLKECVKKSIAFAMKYSS